MTEYILQTKGLKKTFKNVQAVKGVDLNVEKGDIYGFLGPNGAGKTTTIKMIHHQRQEHQGSWCIGPSGHRLFA
jgi:ABC-type multidrug transport system ATPase subunit